MFPCFSSFYTKAFIPHLLSKGSQFTSVLFSHLSILMCFLLVPLFLVTCFAVTFTWTYTLMYHIPVYWHIPSLLSQLPVWLKKVNILIPQLCLLWYLTYLYHLSYLCCHWHICTFSQVTSPESSYICESVSWLYLLCHLPSVHSILSYECCHLTPV